MRAKIEQAATETVYLVDDYAVDIASFDVGHQSLDAGRSMFPPVKPPSS